MSGRKLLLFVIAITAWTSLIAQLKLSFGYSTTDTRETVVRFFSFFTVLTNTLVAVFASEQLFSKTNQPGFFANANTQTAITMYITIVGLVFNAVLRNLWKEGGLQALLNDLLHSVIPLLMIFYWWKYVDGKKATYKSIPFWLIYPAVYAIYTLLRGPFATWYPYPFMNVSELGYPAVFRNSAILVLVFLFFSFLFVFLGKKKPVKTDQS